MSEDARPRAERMNRPRLEEVPVIKLNSWSALEPVYGAARRYEIVRDGVKLEFFTHLKKDAPYLYAWGQGAVDREKLDPPVFQRWSWAAECPYSVLIHSDSTLYLGKINIGWCLGTAEQYYLPYYQEALAAFLRVTGLPPERLLLYGSSAGGFTALMLGGLIPEATVVVNNPQTDVTRYTDRHVGPLLQTCFGGMEFAEARARFPTRLCAWELYRSLGRTPKIYYLQNIHDYSHYENHCKPFVANFPNLTIGGPAPFQIRLRLELYTRSDSAEIHAPLPREETEAAIERARLLYLPPAE